MQWPSGFAQPPVKFDEHIEADGPTVFPHACKMGLEGIVSQGVALPLRPLAGLAEVEEPRVRGGAARGGGGQG
jgi:hypothetical protein